MRHQRCTVVPYGLFFDDIREKRLYARQITNPTLTQSLYFIFRRNLNPAVSAFMVSVIKDIVEKKMPIAVSAGNPYSFFAGCR
jgi:LysR family transcriptional regulator, nitrogen assimilation regulatory protein